MACGPGTGFELERSIFTFTTQKIIPGENRPEDMTCSTLELPPREYWRGSDSNRQPRADRRSNPDLTAWKIGARSRNRTGLVRLTRSARRSPRLPGIGP